MFTGLIMYGPRNEIIKNAPPTPYNRKTAERGWSASEISFYV